MWGWQGVAMSRGCWGKSDLLLSKASLPLTSSQTAFLTIFPSLYSLNVSLSPSPLCLLLSLGSHTLDVLMCVQEEKALAGLEGRSLGTSQISHFKTLPSLQHFTPWWHSLFFPLMVAQNNSGQSWITEIFFLSNSFHRKLWKQAHFVGGYNRSASTKQHVDFF